MLSKVIIPELGALAAWQLQHDDMGPSWPLGFPYTDLGEELCKTHRQASSPHSYGQTIANGLRDSVGTVPRASARHHKRAQGCRDPIHGNLP
jgi:hypothetical protein